jgi:hypothetical protein
MNKPCIFKNFGKLSEEVLIQIKLEYPFGFEKRLIRFINREGSRMTTEEAQ